jgi:hypothetical protein
MFLFCKWFSRINGDEKYRNDLDDVIDELLNLKGDE